MFREKLLTTIAWSAVSIAAAMVADYGITIGLLHAYQSYTPFGTFCIATIVAVPTTYNLVNSRLNLRKARDDLSIARDAACRPIDLKYCSFPI